ncbi:cell wall-active antibiotics response protein LiaF [Paenibacillus thailandensis]|uniref:Cell wall-active antibiotics response protein LiaF n=1 Tax=Paenibacillus thailandensis TaxID=393250 RepID=A0ABW5QRT3_9BACL
MKGRFSFNRIMIGLIVIAIGVLFLLRQTGYVQFELGDLNLAYIISTFWPVILILIGLTGLFNGLFSREGSAFGSIFLILLGVVFLGHNLSWFAWSLGEIFMNLWPVAIILIGIKMLWKPRPSRRETRPDDEEWRPYGRFGDRFDDDYDVPPAPPLHPDPTRPKDETSGARDEEPFAGGRTEEYAHEDETYDWKQRKKQFKHQVKQMKHEFKHHHKHAYKEEYWSYDPGTLNKSGFIGDIHIGDGYWELKPLNISHFIGDTTLDLTKAQINPGETKINISTFIGDVKVYIPNDPDVGVQVVSSAFAGDVKIFGQKEGGLFHSVNIHSPRYQDTDKKIKLVVSTFLGDVRVTKVG